jgi:uncharacterized protein
MPVTPNLITRTVPGVYVNEATYGAIPSILALHDAVYVLGTGAKAGAPINTPIYISNLDDFTNVFGASPSTAAIQLFFDQRSGSGLYFVNVERRVERTVTIPTAVAASVYTITIDGFAINYTATALDTVLTIRNNLGALVNTQLPNTASYYPADGTLRYRSALAVSASANVTLGTATTVGATPLVKDVTDAITLAFQPEMRQGYLCAPEFFQLYTTQADRTALALSMEALVSDPEYYWVAMVDCGAVTATSTTGGGAINLAIAERNTLVSPRGHSWYCFPYLVNLSGVNVPSSLAIIGMSLRRARTEGFPQPPAGVAFPLYGVRDTTFNVTDKTQTQLNPIGINCVRKLPAGRGIVCYGARTLSNSNFYRFASVRVILNVLAGSLKNAFDSTVFTLVDGQGALLSRIKQTAANFCERLRVAGALYGATPEEAYLVVCDLTNNTLDSLESGAVQLDVIVKPSPTLEVLNITLSRASLGAVLAEVVESGDTAPVNQPVTPVTPAA